MTWNPYCLPWWVVALLLLAFAGWLAMVWWLLRWK